MNINVFNLRLRYTPGPEFDETNFAGIFWTNILANIASIFIIVSSTITVVYLILNAIFKLKISNGMNKLLKRDFLIEDIEQMTFFSLINHIKIFNEKETRKRLKEKFINESYGKSTNNTIENQVSSYKNVFINYKILRCISKWNKYTDLLKNKNKMIFREITNLTIIEEKENIIFVFFHKNEKKEISIKLKQNKNIIFNTK